MCYFASLWQRMGFPSQTVLIPTDCYPERSSFTALLSDKDNPHNKLSHSPSLEKFLSVFLKSLITFFTASHPWDGSLKGNFYQEHLEAGKAKWRKKKEKSTEYSLASYLHQVLTAVHKLLFLLNSATWERYLGNMQTSTNFILKRHLWLPGVNPPPLADS